ncbi:hypothetical protein IWX47DRAFT_277061 [Phyllosticta citricarpa]|uniref:Secreted protein n=1 Tax=Phyllosticta citricarpa TaxID=55181 RepID=A0ABR1M2E4_9PEZI
MFMFFVVLPGECSLARSLARSSVNATTRRSHSRNRGIEGGKSKVKFSKTHEQSKVYSSTCPSPAPIKSRKRKKKKKKKSGPEKGEGSAQAVHHSPDIPRTQAEEIPGTIILQSLSFFCPGRPIRFNTQKFPPIQRNRSSVVPGSGWSEECVVGWWKDPVPRKKYRHTGRKGIIKTPRDCTKHCRKRVGDPERNTCLVPRVGGGGKAAASRRKGIRESSTSSFFGITCS